MERGIDGDLLGKRSRGVPGIGRWTGKRPTSSSVIGGSGLVKARPLRPMFNNPRPNQIRYSSGNSNGLAASFVSDNPLSASLYSDDGGLDPWSATPTTPLPPPAPELPGVFSRIIGEEFYSPYSPSVSSLTTSSLSFLYATADAIVPPIYNEALTAVEPNFSGETSLTSLSRVLSTSGLGATTIDRVSWTPFSVGPPQRALAKDHARGLLTLAVRLLASR